MRERRGGVGSCAVAMVREWQPSRVPVDRRVRATHPNTTSSALPFRGVVRSGGGAIVVLPEPAAGAAECRGAQLLKSREILCGTATGHALLERPRVETPHPRASSSLRATEDWLRRPTTQKAAPRTEKFGALIASSVSMCSALSSSASAAPLPLPLPLCYPPTLRFCLPSASAYRPPTVLLRQPPNSPTVVGSGGLKILINR